MFPFSVLQHCGPVVPISIFQYIIKASKVHTLLHTVNYRQQELCF